MYVSVSLSFGSSGDRDPRGSFWKDFITVKLGKPIIETAPDEPPFDKSSIDHEEKTFKSKFPNALEELVNTEITRADSLAD